MKKKIGLGLNWGVFRLGKKISGRELGGFGLGRENSSARIGGFWDLERNFQRKNWVVLGLGRKF